MGNWRGQRDFDDQSRRSFSRKPPNQFWQPTVPAWEKKFCSKVGSVSWSKLLDGKKYMYLYENVVQWNDSAGEEAFLNAKKRFWAHINGLPCELSLPDPNEYIDDVDWESQIDPELILDLDRPPVIVEEEEQNECLKSNLLLFNNESAPATGWGDAEDDLEKNIGWGIDFEEKDCNNCPVSVSYQPSPAWGGESYGGWEASGGGYNFASSFRGNVEKKKRDGRWRNERVSYEKQSPWIGTH